MFKVLSNYKTKIILQTKYKPNKMNKIQININWIWKMIFTEAKTLFTT